MKYCCPECFKSKRLKDIISDESDELGDCDFCESKGVKTFDPERLSDYLRSVLDVYRPSKTSRKKLGEKINEDFKGEMFSLKINNSNNLLKEILKKESEADPKFFESTVELSINLSEKHSVKNIWFDFKKEIKTQNRFHLTKAIDLGELGALFGNGYLDTIYPESQTFYRGRISNKKGYSEDKMKNPPPNFAIPGRSNPKGISYLYLANDIKTTLKEVRAGKFDYITIAEFLNSKEIRILDLHKNNFDPVPWIEKSDTELYLKYSPFLKELVKDLSKPIRKKDREIDYIPSQYISEFCKSIGFDGIAYDSSFSESGFNYAIFKPEKFKIRKIKVYHIDEVDLKITPEINNSSN